MNVVGALLVSGAFIWVLVVGSWCVTTFVQGCYDHPTFGCAFLVFAFLSGAWTAHSHLTRPE
jgi:hypothetical protein